MPASDAAQGAQILSLERRALRVLRATVKSAVAIRDREHVRVALAAHGAVAVLDVRKQVRQAAAAQFQRVTGLPTPPSGAFDGIHAVLAGEAIARAWERGGLSQGGDSGGGGASGSWDDEAATEAVSTSVKRVAAWEVVSAWNEEHRRNARAHPNYKFVERWCAILDAHVCDRCRRMDGRTANRAGEFVSGKYREGWPPIHVGCRCFVVQRLA